MSVYINKIGKFLPNEPVSNEQMESILGMVGGIPSRAREVVLRRNGIKRRYYALDKEGKVTHSNHQLAANAIRALLGNNLKIEEIDLLACGTASPEQIVPSHGVMVHGELGGAKNIEVVSFSGSCCTGIDALKYAFMECELEPNKNAVVSASERSSAWMRAQYFSRESEKLSKLENQPMLAFEKEFLRWMLSDGAYALLLQGKPNKDMLSLKIDWIEITSFANRVETCMYVGGDKDESGELKGWSMFDEDEWLNRSLFAVKQDTRLLSKHIIPFAVEYVLELAKKHDFTSNQADWYLPHLSSMFFKEPFTKALRERGFDIAEEKLFINLPNVGNIASASPYAMLEELLYSGKLRGGEKILLMVPESARFSYAACMLTVVANEG